MKDLWEEGILPKILLLGILMALLGITPLSKMVTAGFEAARRAQEAANPARVAVNLAVVAEQQPWRAGLWEAAGQAALAAGDPQSASEYFSRAARRGELSPQGYLAWGDVEWQAGKAYTALQIWEIAGNQGLPKTEILTRRAEVHRATGDDLALIDDLRALIGLPSAVADLYAELGLLLAAYAPAAAPAYLMQAAELDSSLEPQIRSLNFAIQRELSKNDPVYLLIVAGRELANLGDWELAEKAFSNAVALHPEYAEAWAYLGEARQHNAWGANPLAVLQRAIELDPESIAAHTFMALYWQRQEEHATALAYLQNAAALEPDNPALLIELGNVSALLGNLEAGQEYYRQAMVLRKNEARYVREFLKFSLRYNLNLPEVALPLARQLVIFNPDDPASLDVMGEVLLRLGDLLNAERFFLRALALDPEYDQAHLHLASLYQLQGDAGLAEYHYNQVLELTTNAQTRQRAQEALDEYFSP